MQDEHRPREREEDPAEQVVVAERRGAAERRRGDDEPREHAPPETIGGERDRRIRRLHLEAAEPQIEKLSRKALKG